MTNNHPLVSVMVPTYNQSEYIEKTLNSILSQSYKNIEIIVSDDSNDNLTEEIIKLKYIDKVRYFHNRVALGRVHNYKNLLYNLANGEWVINIDGDDFLDDKYFIEKAVDMIKKYPSIAFVFSKHIIYKEAEDRKIYNNSNLLKRELYDGNWIFLNSIFKNLELPHLSTLYNRKKALELNFYEYDIVSSDRESILKLSIGNQIAYVDSDAGCWVHHSKNISQDISIDDIFKNISMYNRLYKYALKNSNINIFYLFVWKVLAKYKNIYTYAISKQNIQETVFNLFKRDILLSVLLLLDPRVIKKIILKKRAL